MWIVGAIVLAVLGLICWIAYEADQTRKRKQQEALTASHQAELERRARIADSQTKTVGGARITRLDQLPTPNHQREENTRADSFGLGLVEWSEEQERRRLMVADADAMAAAMHVAATPDVGRLESAVVAEAPDPYAEIAAQLYTPAQSFGGGSSDGGGTSGSWGGSDSSSSSSDSSSSSSDGGGGGD